MRKIEYSINGDDVGGNDDCTYLELSGMIFQAAKEFDDCISIEEDNHTYQLVIKITETRD